MLVKLARVYRNISKHACITRMNSDAAQSYLERRDAAHAVLAAHGYTPEKMLWECWRGMELAPHKKSLLYSDGSIYTFTANMTNLGIYDLLVTKDGESSLNVYSFCDR